jgi:hypothetical protein
LHDVCSFAGIAVGGLKDSMLLAIPGTLAILTCECEGYLVIADGDQSHMSFNTETVGAINQGTSIHDSRQSLKGCLSFATPDSAGSRAT